MVGVEALAYLISGFQETVFHSFLILLSCAPVEKGFDRVGVSAARVKVPLGYRTQNTG